MKKFEKALLLAQSSDKDLVALSVTLLLEIITDKKEYNRMKKFLSSTNTKLSANQKLLIKQAAREKSLNAWINEGKRHFYGIGNT